MFSISCPKPLKILTGFIVVSLSALFLAQPVQATDPSLNLTPSSVEYYQGQTFSIDLNLDNPDGLSHSETYVNLSFDETLL